VDWEPSVVRGPGAIVAALLTALLATLALAPAGRAATMPEGLKLTDLPVIPELNFAAPITPPEPCTYDGEDKWEKWLYKEEGWKGPDFTRYPGICERLRFKYGPIVVKPGQNDVLIEPITVQGPRRNGYMVSFKPNLVLADGSVPPVEEVHLHHGTWISLGDQAVSGPFAAAGEEKTIFPAPRGYGIPVKTLDQWLLLYMVHSAVPKPMLAYITYDVDFIPAEKAQEADIKPAHSMWLDVRPSAYPVFNVQRNFGNKKGTCTWPRQKCAGFDPYGNKTVGQGMPGNGEGRDVVLPPRGSKFGAVDNFQGGTLIGLGGHLHPGGLNDQIEVVRDGKSQRIFTSEAVYWDHDNPKKPGGPPTSWDMSMTVARGPWWGIDLKPGDRVRINAEYDTETSATYENMGIAVSFLAPHTADGKPTAKGIDPFKATVDKSPDCYKRGAKNLRRNILCDRGYVTHGHQKANGNHGGPMPGARLNTATGPATRNVAIANFRYFPGDLSSVQAGQGVPTVKLGSTLNFTNLEGAVIYHTITSCRFPCLGPTGAAFPIPNGRTSNGRKLDLDSSELGIGIPFIGPAKQDLNWKLPVTKAAGYEAGETVTYFCRIHPFMRGAFKVEE
jgi:hypothetical protein